MNIKILMGMSSYFLSTLPGSKKLGGSKAGRRSGIDKKRMTPNLHWKSSFVRPQGLEPWTH